jgi:hypothetical protein
MPQRKERKMREAPEFSRERVFFFEAGFVGTRWWFLLALLGLWSIFLSLHGVFQWRLGFLLAIRVTKILFPRVDPVVAAFPLVLFGL